MFCSMVLILEDILTETLYFFIASLTIEHHFVKWHLFLCPLMCYNVMFFMLSLP